MRKLFESPYRAVTVGRARRALAGKFRGALVMATHPGLFASIPTLKGRPPAFGGTRRIRVGGRFATEGRLFRSELATGASGQIRIGDDVFINQGVRVYSDSAISIGNRVEIADLVTIHDTNFHRVEPGDTVKLAPVRIGDDCWIGTSAIILPGVVLGRGTVVGAGAVVSKSFPAGSVIAGNPARLLRTFELPEGYKRRGWGHF